MEIRVHGGSRGDRWLLASMAACLALLGVLLWQGVESTRGHVAMARQVLSDYAELAAGNYARALKRTVGYRIVHQVGQTVGSDPDQAAQRLLDASAIDPLLGEALQTVRSTWHWSPASGDLRCLHGRCVGFDAISLADFNVVEAPPEGFVVLHRSRSSGIETAALYPTASGQDWIGVELHPKALESWYREIAETADLLPAALLSANSAVHPGLQLLAPDGSVVFAHGPLSASALTGRATIDDDYGGLFEGFVVRAGLNPELAPDLIIGGLPRSRLPALVLLALLTLALTLAVFRVIWRERQLARLRSDFVARVSHELRTPLTQIRMFAETLLLGRERDPQTSHLYLRIIDREARRLGHLVDNVLAFSGRQQVTGRLAMAPCSLRSLLGEIVTAFEPIASGAGSRVVLDVRGDPVAWIDGEGLRQVMLNLLDNACKYGPEDQTVRVGAEQCGSKVHIRVCDQGPGIPEADRVRVWHAFERLARDERRARHGTGIGLAVSGELLAAMGARSTIGGGSSGAVFEMVFDAAQEPLDVTPHPAD